MSVLTKADREELAVHLAKAREIKSRQNAPIKARMKAEKKARDKAIDHDRKEQRQPRQRDAGYLAFLRRLPCIAGLMGDGDCEGATQSAHLRFSDHKQGRTNPGLQSKPSDRHATPLCAAHHLRDQHAGEERAFWSRLGIDPGDLSRALYAAYEADGDGLAVLRRFVPNTLNEKDA